MKTASRLLLVTLVLVAPCPALAGPLDDGPRREGAREEQLLVGLPEVRNLAAPLTSTLGTIPVGKSVTVKIRATVDDVPIGTTELSAQGTVSGTNFSDVLTDDPDVGGATDPTVTVADDPGVGSCTIAFNPDTEAVAVGGGTATLNVEALPGCPWTVTETSDPDDIGTLEAPTTGTGDGASSVTVIANPTALARVATYTVTVDGTAITDTFTVTQPAAACTISVDPDTETIGTAGGTATLNVTTLVGCAWTVTETSDPDDIGTLLGTTGTDSGSVSITVAANADVGDKSAVYTATIDGTSTTDTFTVVSEGTGNTAPTAVDDAYAVTEGQTLTVNAANGVLADDTDAESDPLTAVLVSGPAHGALALAANGSFTYTPDVGFTGADAFLYKANDGTLDSDEATVTITVNACTYAISPTSASFGLFSGGGTVTVTAPDGCAWTAVSNDSWITVESGASGSGDGAVTFKVARNNSGAARSGTMTIAGETFTVGQSLTGGSLSIAPLAAGFAIGGGEGTVEVASVGDLDWSAVSNVSWITVVSGASGSGNGTVSYAVAENTTGSTRTGTLTIAGEAFEVTQAGAASSIKIITDLAAPETDPNAEPAARTEEDAP